MLYQTKNGLRKKDIFRIGDANSPQTSQTASELFADLRLGNGAIVAAATIEIFYDASRRQQARLPALPAFTDLEI